MEKKNYLQSLILEGTHVNLFLKNGFKMTGLVITHESKEYFLVRDSKRERESMVFKNVISTIQRDPKIIASFPNQYETEGEEFIEHCISQKIMIRIYIQNGFQFTCRILEDAGEYFLVKDANGVDAIVFKAHISTIE